MCGELSPEFPFHMPEIALVGSGGKFFESGNTNICHHPNCPLINCEDQGKMNELKIDSMAMTPPNDVITNESSPNRFFESYNICFSIFRSLQ